MDKKAWIELAKSFGRFIWFGLLGLVGTFLASAIANEDFVATVWTVGSISVPIGVWVISGVTLVIKAIDTYVHNATTIKANGIALPFLQK